MSTVKVELPEGFNPEDVQGALALLTRTREQRQKQADKLKNNPVAKEAARVRGLRQRVKQKLTLAKAVREGIVVTEEEVQAYLDATGQA